MQVMREMQTTVTLHEINFATACTYTLYTYDSQSTILSDCKLLYRTEHAPNTNSNKDLLSNCTFKSINN